ncbi:MAG: DMT family transporter, partial [Alphaproteobacteria bacterium]
LQALRGLFVIAAATLFVYSVRALPLTTTTAIGFISPLFVTILSIAFLKEKVGLRRWAAIVVGFFGVLAILQPGSDAFSLAMLLPIASSMCWAASLVITRAMRSGERPFATLVWTTAVGFLAIAPLGLATWRPPDAGQMALIAALAGLHVAAQLLTIRAFSLSAATALAPFSYVSLVWATVIGYLAFDALPDGRTLAGAAILAGAGLYVWRRELVAARKAV